MGINCGTTSVEFRFVLSNIITNAVKSLMQRQQSGKKDMNLCQKMIILFKITKRIGARR